MRKYPVMRVGLIMSAFAFRLSRRTDRQRWLLMRKCAGHSEPNLAPTVPLLRRVESEEPLCILIVKLVQYGVR